MNRESHGVGNPLERAGVISPQGPTVGVEVVLVGAGHAREIAWLD